MNPQTAIVPNALRRASVLTHAVLSAADLLGLTQASLADVLGVSPATVTRMAQGGNDLREGSNEWELATLFVRLYRGLDAIMASDKESLRSWMQNPNKGLHAVPADHIRTIQGLVDTVAYVDAYRARI